MLSGSNQRYVISNTEKSSQILKKSNYDKKNWDKQKWTNYTLIFIPAVQVGKDLKAKVAKAAASQAKKKKKHEVAMFDDWPCLQNTIDDSAVEDNQTLGIQLMFSQVCED